MGEPAVADDLHDAVLDRRTKATVDLGRIGRGSDRIERRCRQGRDDLERFEGLGRKPLEAVLDELLKAVRDRRSFAGRHVTSTAKERESDLLCEEGIASRHLVEVQERGPGEPFPTLARRTRSRASSDSGPTWTACTRSSATADTTPRGSSSARRLERPSSTQPARPSGAARRTGAPGPKGCPSTGRHRRPPRPERWRPPIGGIQARPGKRLAGRLGRPISGTARGPPRGPALWLRHGRECLLEDGLEEVTEGGVGQSRLGLDRTARERAVAPS